MLFIDSVLRLQLTAGLSLVDGEGPGAEALGGGEDVVGGLGPAEGRRVGVRRLDRGPDAGLQLGGRAMGTAAQGLVGRRGEEALGPVEPGAEVGGGARASVAAWRTSPGSAWSCGCRRCP